MQTNFSQIQFNSTYHTYTYQGKRLKNVTSMVSSLNPFDKDGTAARIAEREGREVEDVLAEWEVKGKESRERGTRVHEAIADVLGGVVLDDDPILALNETLPEIEAFKYLWKSLAEVIEVLRIEWIVGDTELGIAGTVDTLAKQGDSLHIFDWKTGDKFRVKSEYNAQCLPPFDDLDDCELVKYSLQTSLYRLCLERNAETNDITLPIGDSYIVHLSKDGGYKVYKAIDLRERLIEWLESESDD